MNSSGTRAPTVSRDPGRLYSAGGVVGGPDVGRFRYYLDVLLNPCEGGLLAGYDLNSDDAVTVAGDLPAWLMGPVDFNEDSATDGADVGVLESAAELYAQPASVTVFYEGPWDDVELP